MCTESVGEKEMGREEEENKGGTKEAKSFQLVMTDFVFDDWVSEDMDR